MSRSRSRRRPVAAASRLRLRRPLRLGLRLGLSRSSCVAFAAFALALCAAPVQAERRLSLAEATRLALAQNPELKLEDAKVEEAALRRMSVRGNFGPKLMADASLLVWNSALKFTLNTPDISKMNLTVAEATTLIKYGDLMSLLPKLFDLGNIREQATAQLQLTLAQPLTPLLQVYEGHKATERLHESTALDRDAKRLDVLHRVKQTYLQLMQVQRMAEVAKTGVDQVEQHLKRARQFNAAGLIGKQEVLKARVELARARERWIKARYGISLASSALSTLLGFSVDETVTPTEQVADPPPPAGKSLAGCLQQATTRAEIAAIAKKQQAAIADHRRSRYDLVPQISAIATYQLTHGQGTFVPTNAFFFGAVLKWEIWDWGGKYYNARAARARVAQAELGKRLARDGVALQTKKAYLDLQESDEALTVAREVITEAEENFRIEQRRFESNANTSTEVLDAQLSLTRAKLSYTAALYSHYIARAALERAVGQGE